MFIKLVVLILVCGSSGVGVLSVRQSRLQAAHEMAEARHRTIRLEEQAGEIRSQIAQACTPDRVVEMLNNRWDVEEGYDPSVHHPAKFGVDQDQSGKDLVDSETTIDRVQDTPAWIDNEFRTQHAEILDDGWEILILDD